MRADERAILPHLGLISGLMSMAIDPRLGASTDRKSTDHDILTTLGDTFTTLRDTVQKSTYVGSPPIF